ncbi:hypothetical protein [Catenulispora rubra]|uniref:hypothetical protein n=1 Tax=Catenulispora rubra TaxID=280293 RepID=UPI001892398B|nr:hypothetical protein [Catenulispora rubra]
MASLEGGVMSGLEHLPETTGASLPVEPAIPLTRGMVAITVPPASQPDISNIGNIVRFIAEWQPDRLLLTAPGLAWGCRQDLIELLKEIRRVYQLPVVIQTNALTVPGVPQWKNQCLETFAALNMTPHAGIYAPAPGWYSVCSSEPPMSTYAGAIAILLARALRASVLCAGADRMGIIEETVGKTHSDGKTLWGIELAEKARQGFLILESTPLETKPTVVPIHRDGSFTVAGVTYN